MHPQDALPCGTAQSALLKVEEMQPQSQGASLSGPGREARDSSQGLPRVLRQPPCWATEPLCLSPEGQMSQQRQEELEAMCTQLQRQVGEMEVRGGRPGAGSEAASLGPLPPTPHRALLRFPYQDPPATERARKVSRVGHAFQPGLPLRFTLNNSPL